MKNNNNNSNSQALHLLLLVLLLILANDVAVVAVGSKTNSKQEDFVVEDKFYNVDVGILKRVTERLDAVMNLPREAITILERYHHYQGFRPHGLHATGRDAVLTYLYSLIQAYDGTLKLYVGTERGEYFTYFDTEAVYREPGNSGYDPNDPDMQQYWTMCVNGNDGTKENCTMAEGANYVRCIDDCKLAPCPDDASQNALKSQRGNSDYHPGKMVKWCPSYMIDEVKVNQTLGFVPVGYHCIDDMGMFSQEPGKVMDDYLADGIPPFVPNGTCMHWDGTPVTGSIAGKYASCRGAGDENDSDENGISYCTDAFPGLMRTVDYDPRVRPWYISTKETQKESWSTPYPFHTHSNIITRIGITYAQPYYSLLSTSDNSQLRTVFEGVMAVDYTLSDISLFLTDNYGGVEDRVVVIMEAAEPYFLIGISTGTSPYKEVLASNESMPCLGEDDDCVTVRVPATDLGHANPLDPIASEAVQAQSLEGFPTETSVSFQASDSSYFCHSVRYAQSGTDLEWVVIVASPMILSNSDTILPGNTLFIALVLVATAGSVSCCVLLYLWYSKRNESAVKHGDFNFTSAFLIGCILLNLSSFTSIGENTDLTCMLRFWAHNVTFALAISPLFVKVYRIYKLIGAAGRLTRTTISQTQAFMRTLPIIALQVLILLIFTFFDPPQATEEIDYEPTIPIQHIMCRSDTRAFLYTESVFRSLLIMVGCILSFKSRNLDSRFGEAKQLLFGMYNVAFTGICFLVLVNVTDVTPAGVLSFRTVCIFWGTVLTSMAFVLPRLLRTMDDYSRPQSSVFISGLDAPSTDSIPPFRTRHKEQEEQQLEENESAELEDGIKDLSSSLSERIETCQTQNDAKEESGKSLRPKEHATSLPCSVE